MADWYPEDISDEKKESFIKEKLSDFAGLAALLITWPLDKLIELDLDKGKKMTIKWLEMLPDAGFDVSEYEIPKKGEFNNGGMIEIYYRGRQVLSMSNNWSSFYLKSFIKFDTDDYKWGDVDNTMITSKKDLVRYLESVREEVYPDPIKCDIVDKLLDVAEDL